MMNYKKYQRQYYMPPAGDTDWVNKESVEHAPVWCSVDLRDGNQALVIPMSLEPVSYTHLSKAAVEVRRASAAVE